MKGPVERPSPPCGVVLGVRAPGTGHKAGTSRGQNWNVRPVPDLFRLMIVTGVEEGLENP